MKAKAKQNDELIGAPWEWGKDLRNSLNVARDTQDPVQLKKMVRDILSEKVEDNGEISEELIYNEDLPFAQALKLARKWGGRFADALCDRRDAPASALIEFCEHFDAISAEAFLDHPNIDPDATRKLADRVNPAIIVWMIENNEIPRNHLKKYVDHESAFVRESVAATCDDPTMLKLLARDADIKVRAAVCNNLDVPLEIVEELAFKNDNTMAKIVAAMRTRNPELLTVLANNLSSREDVPVAQAIKKNDQAPDCEKTRAAKIVAALQQNQL